MTPPTNPQVTRPPIQQLSDALWVGVPLVVRRFSAGLAVAAVDGLHLAVRPLIGLISVPTALAFGVIVGVFHPGFEQVFTEALWLLVLVALVGAISGTLGLYFTVGFAIGDLILGEHPLWGSTYQTTALDIVAMHGSWLLSYMVLALLAVGVPIAAKSLASEFSLPQSVVRPVRGLVAVSAVVGVTALLVFVWVQSAPLLVRPIFVWSGQAPTVSAISPLQVHGGLIVAAAAGGAFVRVLVLLILANQAHTAMQGGHAPAGARLIALEQRFRTTVEVRPLLSRLPLAVRLIGRAFLLTVLLSGLLSAYWQALLTFLVLLVAQVVVSPLMPIGLGVLSRVLARVPRLVRLVVALVPVYLLGTFIFDYFLERGTTSFIPFLVVTMISAVLMTLLSPNPPADEQEGAS